MIETAEYERWTALEMAALVRAGEVTGSELHEACSALMDERDPAVRGVARRTEPAAVEAPAAADAPFAGVPFAVKELLAVPGLPLTMGSRLLATNPPGPPPPYAERLLGAGLHVVCSTRSSEFGLLGSAEALLHGRPTANPWGEGLSPAGSSGGAAALVAAGVLPMAHASDGGGSIRVPASATGLFGFKPSNRRTVPAGPDEGVAALVVDHVVSRSVADSAALLAVTERRGPDAPWAPVGRVDAPLERRLRVGVVERTLLGARPEPAVAAELARTRRLLEDLGHATEDLDLSAVDGQAVSDGFFVLSALALADVAAAMTAALGRAPGPDELEPFTLELIEHAATLPAGTAERCTRSLADAAAAYTRSFATCDVVLSPTLARRPWPTGFLSPGLGRVELIHRTEQAVGYTPIHNAAACPAMSVPLGWADGLPVGMHLAAAPGDDALLLGLALALEAAAPWAGRRPDPAALTTA
jgi:amidase